MLLSDGKLSQFPAVTDFLDERRRAILNEVQGAAFRPFRIKTIVQRPVAIFVDAFNPLLNEQGVVAKAYKVYRCWVSEYQAIPELDSNANAVAIESMTVQNEGWERDEAVTEPTET